MIGDRPAKTVPYRVLEHPVVLIHGALRSRVGLWPTARWLNARGLFAMPFGYSTRRGTLVDHADALAAWLDTRLGDHPVPVLGFLTHSMGALVARVYLHRHLGRHARHYRIAMLSPPNRGAELAYKNRNNPLMHWLYGDATEELQPAAVLQLPGFPPPVDALVLAGGRGDGRGFNRFITGDDDGVVGVAEMGLPGIEPEFVGGVHAWLQWRPAILERATSFLKGAGSA